MLKDKDMHCQLLYTIILPLFIVFFKFINANKRLSYAVNTLSMNKHKGVNISEYQKHQHKNPTNTIVVFSTKKLHL